jgi:tRNA-uridine 2-sulfurtransferase
MPEYVAIALSGGIDSLVSAALLQEQGHRVVGLHFLTGFETAWRSMPSASSETPPPVGAEERAMQQLAPMVHQLDIPIHIIDLSAEFRSLVVDYFSAAYQAGRTPNPCLVCNPRIKFDLLLNKARELGASRIATGHYARISSDRRGRMHLLRGKDPLKEQSYFLARLCQAQLQQAVLPLGDWTKTQTRQLAQSRGLRPAAAQESQDICFIKGGSYGDFLKQQPGFCSAAGDIEDPDGRVIGRHSGLYQFTIGQRRGINCPAAAPYYVIRLDVARNVLVVGPRQALLAHGCRVEQINWIVSPPGDAIRVAVRVRYRQAAVPARLVALDANRADIVFDRPEGAVTPGQGAVFYDGDEVLGGGWIQ